MTDGPNERRLDDLATRYWAFCCREFPAQAIAAGVGSDEDVVFREAPADHERRRVAAGAFFDELRAIDAAALAPASRTTLRMLRHELKTAIALHDAGAHETPPLFPSGPADACVNLANMTTLASTDDADRWVARLRTFPQFLRDVEATLSAGRRRGARYPVSVLAAAAAHLRATAAVPVERTAWYGPFARAAPTVEEAAGQRAARIITESTMPAFREHADFLERFLGERARDSIACGDGLGESELYAAFVLQHATTAQSPDTIHEVGLAEVARLEAELDYAGAAAGYDDRRDCRAAIAGDPALRAPSGQALRDEFRALCKRIDGVLPRWFATVPRSTYGVESIPASAAARMPFAYAQPPPANRRAAGIFYVTPDPERCLRHLHVAIALHEAWPGHLMHLAVINERDDLPMFRRHGAAKSAALIEGWGLYCEWLGEEMGLYDTPVQRFGRLEMEMLRAVRLVVDTGIHARGWTRQESLRFMTERLTTAGPALEAEVDRYIAMPAQALAYQLGNLAVREARRTAERAFGRAFDVREFHDAVLALGGVSLPVLEASMHDMAAKHRAETPNAAS